MARIYKICSVFLILILAHCNLSYSCGPYFDSAYLVRGSKEQFLSLPEGSFRYELERIAGHKRPEASEVDVKNNTADSDISDLEKSLEKLPSDKREKALASYADARSRLLYYLKSYPVEQEWVWYGGSFRHHERGYQRLPFKMDPDFEFDNEIPKEFTLYFAGAIDYHNNNFEQAIKKWEELLSLPRPERQYRSVWASFMIGKAYLSLRQQGKAIQYFEKTREYASGGFGDSLNLAYESYGWQALAEYEDGDYVSSINHYLEQIDVNSLNWICRKVFELDEENFKAVVKDNVSRDVLIAWAVSQSPWTYWYRTIQDDPNQNIYNRLLSVISQIENKKEINNADRIAWIFYNHGDFSNTAKWIKLAKTQTPLSRWIESKLLLREGKIDEALSVLKGLIPLFEKDKAWDMFFKTDKDDVVRNVNTEVGVLQLRRQDYIAALETLINGGAYWEDIAYVAEKVLSSDELENYLSKASGEGLSRKLEWHNVDGIENPTVSNALKYLLARRFAREENKQKALEYMPTVFNRNYWKRTPSEEGYLIHQMAYETINPKEILANYYSHLDKGKNTKLSKAERARNYYEGALIMRKYGMELFGTELDPDWFTFNGQFAYDDTIEQRFGMMNKDRQEYYKGWYDELIEQTKERREEILNERNFFAGSKDEEVRALKSLPSPSRRFHYRFKASDLMWKCSQLLPDNDELKANALCLGGTYIKIRDPKAADKFYKELVRTCGDTDLGKEANKLKWFPKISESE